MTQAPRPRATRTRLLTAAVSAVCHLAVLLAFVGAPADAPPRIDPPAVQVRLVELRPEPPAPPAPKPGPEPSAPAADPPKPAPEPPRKIAARRPAARPDAPSLPVDAGPQGPSDADVSDAELASAAGVGVGRGSGGGRTCDMLAWLQRKLRDDRRVQAAMAAVHDGRAIRVWNGDWVRHPGQEGNGLAAVREAIMWEVAFAPEACRRQRVQGLVQVSLNDAPGSARVVMGSADWRWSDVVTRSRR